MRKPMDDPNNTTDTLDQTAEELLTYTVSDEELEAATGFGAGPLAAAQTQWGISMFCRDCGPPR
jgi:hypothetical protein